MVAYVKPLEDVHLLTPRTYEYVMIYGKEE